MIRPKPFKFYCNWTSILFVGVFVLASCAPPPTEKSCFFVRNQQKQRVSWGPRLPITLHLHNSIPEEYKEAIVNATLAWESAANYQLFVIKEGDSSWWPSSNSKSVIYWKTDWEENLTHEQARTTIHWTGDQITDADIVINSRDYTFYTNDDYDENGQLLAYSNNANRHLHLESLMIHELGHVLGLQHNEDSESMMQKGLSGHTRRDEVAAVDLDNLQCEYDI